MLLDGSCNRRRKNRPRRLAFPNLPALRPEQNYRLKKRASSWNRVGDLTLFWGSVLFGPILLTIYLLPIFPAHRGSMAGPMHSPADACARLGADVDRYSFTVRDS